MTTAAQINTRTSTPLAQSVQDLIKSASDQTKQASLEDTESTHPTAAEDGGMSKAVDGGRGAENMADAVSQNAKDPDVVEKTKLTEKEETSSKGEQNASTSGEDPANETASAADAPSDDTSHPANAETKQAVDFDSLSDEDLEKLAVKAASDLADIQASVQTKEAMEDEEKEDDDEDEDEDEKKSETKDKKKEDKKDDYPEQFKEASDEQIEAELAPYRRNRLAAAIKSASDRADRVTSYLQSLDDLVAQGGETQTPVQRTKSAMGPGAEMPVEDTPVEDPAAMEAEAMASEAAAPEGGGDPMMDAIMQLSEALGVPPEQIVAMIEQELAAEAAGAPAEEAPKMASVKVAADSKDSKKASAKQVTRQQVLDDLLSELHARSN